MQGGGRWDSVAACAPQVKEELWQIFLWQIFLIFKERRFVLKKIYVKEELWQIFFNLKKEIFVLKKKVYVSLC